jgi:hypothetical protein
MDQPLMAVRRLEAEFSRRSGGPSTTSPPSASPSTGATAAVVLTALRRGPEHCHRTALVFLDDLDRIDQLDLADYEFSPEPAVPGVVGGSEVPALARFTRLVAAGFFSIVALIILMSVALR